MSNEIFKINCILPIYNNEKNIDNLLDCIIKQSIGFENINLTIVDCETKDEIKNIIKKYQKQYSNIKLKTIKSENNKLSILKDLNEEYVIILDSQLQISKNHIMNLYEGIKEGNNDICIGRANHLKNNKLNIILKNIKGQIDEDGVYEKIFLSLIPLTSFIFKVSEIKKIFFNEECNRVEDLLFKLRILHNCNRINVITLNNNEMVYSGYDLELFNDIKTLCSVYEKSIHLIDGQDELKNRYKALIAIYLIFSLQEIDNIKDKEELFKYIKVIINNLDKELDEIIGSIKDTKLRKEIDRTVVFIKQDKFNLYLDDLSIKTLLKNSEKIKKEIDNYKKLVGGQKLKLNIRLNKFIYNVKKIYFATIYYLTKPYFALQDVWLIGERTDQAEDNSYHFFKYCRINEPNKKIYYIIDKKSEQYNNIKRFGNIIQYDSFKHKIYLMHANKFISAYNFHKFSYPSNEIEFYRYIEKYIKAEKIFLQHGVAMNSAPYYKQSINKYNYIVTSTQKETNMLVDKYNWDEKNILKTGLARYDNLKDESKNNIKKKILFMPTWRRCLSGISIEEFKESNYYKDIYSLLTSRRLNKLIDDKNIEFIFYIHYEMQDYIDVFKSLNKNIKVLEKSQANVQQLLKYCNLLITDFSSVGIDFAYMDKPVIFYQYNKQDFHYDINKDDKFIMYKDFGYILENEDDVLSQLEDWTDKNYYNFYKIKEDIFYNRDFNNCKRIFNYIDKIKVSENKKSIIIQDEKNENTIRIYNKNYTISERIDFYPNGVPKKRFIYVAREINKVIKYNKIGKAKEISNYWNSFKYKTTKVTKDKYQIPDKETYLIDTK